MPESFFNNVAASICSFIQKETLAQVLTWEFCKIFKNIFLLRARNQERNSGTHVFLWILWKFEERIFCRAPLGDCFLWVTFAYSRPLSNILPNIYDAFDKIHEKLSWDILLLNNMIDPTSNFTESVGIRTFMLTVNIK